MVAAPAPAGNEGLVLPGQPLLFPPRAPLPQPGIGAYTRDSQLLASVVGHQRPGEGTIQGLPSRFVVPQPSSVVLGRVTRVTPRQATLSILVVDGRPCSSGDWRSCGFANHAAGEDPSGSGGDFTGVVRQQDVRATEKDKGSLTYKPARSRSEMRGPTISQRHRIIWELYMRCHARSDRATSLCCVGSPTVETISWQEMRNPMTGTIEKRKVAKPE
ncbi:hypothetical protein L7F22_025699 [Adiantum nelumboides]|nr:hypothetical protein [Adiantum nelumboides]